MEEYDEHIVYGDWPFVPLEDERRARSEAATEARANRAEAASRRAVEYDEPEQEEGEHD